MDLAACEQQIQDACATMACECIGDPQLEAALMYLYNTKLRGNFGVKETEDIIGLAREAIKKLKEIGKGPTVSLLYSLLK
jgi:hypothetical protein